MFGTADIATLLDMARVYPIRNGWQIVIRAELVDATPQRPHGLSYAFILQDQQEQRVLGFDNSHAYDGASPDEPFDHEHPAGRVDKRIRYDFKTAGGLIGDGFDRCEEYFASHGMEFEVML
ncbi:DUF6516 family protein [Methylobacterium sp. Leaf93]|uniref:toxin-antitoxin system TumE family protein n=1 Tax=Methylobacterium sp. Leaf93 TaxID=1736249 RepID=UPI0012E931B5|nr:DUF6516 family protein [Methylobacterium sp. Leaf93]